MRRKRRRKERKIRASRVRSRKMRRKRRRRRRSRRMTRKNKTVRRLRMTRRNDLPRALRSHAKFICYMMPSYLVYISNANVDSRVRRVFGERRVPPVVSQGFGDWERLSVFGIVHAPKDSRHAMVAAS